MAAWLKNPTMCRWTTVSLSCLVTSPVLAEENLRGLQAAGRALPAAPGLSVLALLGLALLLIGITRLRR